VVIITLRTDGAVQASNTEHIGRAALGVAVESHGADRGERSGRRRCGKTDDDSRIAHIYCRGGTS
jgi:hypothetical protein